MEATDKPAPVPISIIVSPLLILFCSIARDKANGIEAETQLPYCDIIFITQFSEKPPNLEYAFTADSDA